MASGTMSVYNKRRIFTGQAVTPSEHYNYIDINRTQAGVTYDYIIVSCASNTGVLICAYQIDSSKFRIVARNPDGSSYESEIRINYILSIANLGR